MPSLMTSLQTGLAGLRLPIVLLPILLLLLLLRPRPATHLVGRVAEARQLRKCLPWWAGAASKHSRPRPVLVLLLLLLGGPGLLLAMQQEPSRGMHRARPGPPVCGCTGLSLLLCADCRSDLVVVLLLLRLLAL